jgi:hypothetical protein
MPSYLVEGYFPRSRAGELTGLIAGLRAAAEEMTAEGMRVRHVRSSFLPADELFLHLIEAESAEAAGRLTERAGITLEWIAESLQVH